MTRCSMTRYSVLCFAMSFALAAFAQAPTEAGNKGSSLQVRVKYTGAGSVDEAHKIYVSLWDTPDFAKEGSSGMPPFVTMPVTSKSGTAKFQDVQKSPVYVGIAYDPTGKWDAQSEPPAGTSLGLYNKEKGVPAPIQLEPGKTTKVSAMLDDSYKKSDMEKKQ